MANHPGVREIIGVPAIPPARVVSAGTRVRQWVGRLHRAMVPPPVQILEGVFGLLDHGALVALVDLGVADALTGKMAVPELAARVGAAPEPFERLVRYSASRGWVRLDRRGRIGPSSTTPFLRRDHPGGWAAWVELMAGAEVTEAVGQLSGAVRSGRDAFTLANGSPFFDWMSAHSERGTVFDRAMAAGGRMHGLALAHALDWADARRVCDVGGGDGSMLRVLLAREPHLHGVVVDLPEVTGRAEPGDRLEFRGGDAFASVPGECDTYLFVNVLHDWSDADAVRLLSRVATDAPSGSQVIVVEGHRTKRPLADIATSTDLLMLAVAPGGRERTASELDDLGRSAGLLCERVVPLASGDFAQVFVTRQSTGRDGVVSQAANRSVSD